MYQSNFSSEDFGNIHDLGPWMALQRYLATVRMMMQHIQQGNVVAGMTRAPDFPHLTPNLVFPHLNRFKDKLPTVSSPLDLSISKESITEHMSDSGNEEIPGCHVSTPSTSPPSQSLASKSPTTSSLSSCLMSSSPSKPAYHPFKPEGIHEFHNLPHQEDYVYQQRTWGFDPLSPPRRQQSKDPSSPYTKSIGSIKKIKKKKILQCSECSYKSDRKNNLVRHITSMHKERKERFFCCDQLFSTKSEQQRHKKEKHQHGFECKFCGNKFLRKPLLDRHLRCHYGDGNEDSMYECSLCFFKGGQKSQLERHLRCHKFRCPGGQRSHVSSKKKRQPSPTSIQLSILETPTQLNQEENELMIDRKLNNNIV